MNDSFFLRYDVELRSPQAYQFASLLMPLANHLAYLPFQAMKVMTPVQFKRIMVEMKVLLDKVKSAIEADRTVLTKKQSAIKILYPVNLKYDLPIKRHCRCCHALSNTLCMILSDLIELDEHWCTFACNADLAHTVSSPEQSEFEAYLTKQREWIDRIKKLTSELKLRKKQLKQACYTKSATPQDNMEEILYV